jgi:hypothetical protein
MANCNKCKSNRCGCGDSALSMPATFSNCPTVCPPDSEKCTELFLAECVCWPGPDICELDVKTGDRLDEIFRKIILTVSQISCKVGLPGENGASAYEQWLSYGNVGTEQEFLASLIGVAGLDGLDGTDGIDGINGTNGIDGTNGTDGTIISLTTVGTSGLSTLSAGGVLNIPEYAGGGGFVHYLGEEFEGGVIYYLYKDNLGVERGLIVNTAEQTLTSWQFPTSLTTGDRTEDGAYNTLLMTNSDAANYVNALVDGGFTDWYLASIDELNLLYNNRYSANKALRTIGGADLLSRTASYWSSTENDLGSAYSFNFNGGSNPTNTKNSIYTVRGIRSF